MADAAHAQTTGSDQKTGAGATVGAPGTENNGGSGSGMSSSGGTNTGSSTTGTTPNEMTVAAPELTYCPRPHGTESGGAC